MKTALQELIKWMEGQYYPAMYEDAIDKATELLEKERENMRKSFNKGVGSMHPTGHGMSFEQYYNEKFKQ